jgi:hypothetical protein
LSLNIELKLSGLLHLSSFYLNKTILKIFSLQVRRGNKIGHESNFVDNNEFLNELKKFTNDENDKINYVYVSTDDIGLINDIEKK